MKWQSKNACAMHCWEPQFSVIKDTGESLCTMYTLTYGLTSAPHGWVFHHLVSCHTRAGVGPVCVVTELTARTIDTALIDVYGVRGSARKRESERSTVKCRMPILHNLIKILDFLTRAFFLTRLHSLLGHSSVHDRRGYEPLDHCLHGQQLYFGQGKGGCLGQRLHCTQLNYCSIF